MRKRLLSVLNRNDPKSVVADVAAGKNIVTLALVFLSAEEDGPFLTELVEHGLLDAILDLVEPCCDRMFPESLPEGADLKCPSSWTNVLYKFTVPNALTSDKVYDMILIRIAKRIKPMVACMVDLEKREFFKRRDLWYPNCLSFVGIILNLFESSMARSILLEDDETEKGQKLPLLEFLVQALFFDAYRPDLMGEFQKYKLDHVLPTIQRDATHCLRLFSDTSGDSESNADSDGGDFGDIPEDRNQDLRMLGNLPAVDPKYASIADDGTKMGERGVTFTGEILDIACRKSSEFWKDDPASLKSLLWCVFQLGLVMDKEDFGNDAARKLVHIGLHKALLLPSSPSRQGEDDDYDDESGGNLDTLLLTICEMTRYMKSPEIPFWDDAVMGSMVEEGLLEFLLKVLLETEKQSSHPTSALVWDETADIVEGIEILIRNEYGGESSPLTTSLAVSKRFAATQREMKALSSPISMSTRPKDLASIEKISERVEAVLQSAAAATPGTAASPGTASSTSNSDNKRDAAAMDSQQGQKDGGAGTSSKVLGCVSAAALCCCHGRVTHWSFRSLFRR